MHCPTGVLREAQPKCFRESTPDSRRCLHCDCKECRSVHASNTIDTRHVKTCQVYRLRVEMGGQRGKA